MIIVGIYHKMKIINYENNNSTWHFSI